MMTLDKVFGEVWEASLTSTYRYVTYDSAEKYASMLMWAVLWTMVDDV